MYEKASYDLEEVQRPCKAVEALDFQHPSHRRRVGRRLISFGPPWFEPAEVSNRTVSSTRKTLLLGYWEYWTDEIQVGKGGLNRKEVDDLSVTSFSTPDTSS